MTLHCGDCIDVMRGMDAGAFNCCVTSPPYYGLRDYGHDGQIGLEKTPDEYVARLVDVFREVRRVLRDDGTLWLNLGDSYGGSSNSGGKNCNDGGPAVRIVGLKSKASGMHPKNLLGIPWRVAFALQADGWYLRQDIIWHKPNPMPESVTDRCTKAHEYVFLLSKQARYYYDADAVKEVAMYECIGQGKMGAVGTTGRNDAPDIPISHSRKAPDGHTRNRRSVWTVATQPYSEAHFATFPPDLIKPCILAGCPEGGHVLDPFLGSGTTVMVAQAMGRVGHGIELNAEYFELAKQRTAQQGLVFA
jgi:DNA modification methylase